jgi:hypothetical protein
MNTLLTLTNIGLLLPPTDANCQNRIRSTSFQPYPTLHKSGCPTSRHLIITSEIRSCLLLVFLHSSTEVDAAPSVLSYASPLVTALTTASRHDSPLDSLTTRQPSHATSLREARAQTLAAPQPMNLQHTTPRCTVLCLCALVNSRHRWEAKLNHNGLFC